MIILSLLISLVSWAEVGVTESEIVIGSSGSYSGSNAAAPSALRDGALKVYEKVNAQGGIHGRKIRFVALDDGYDPQKSKTNGEALINKHKVFAFVHGNGGAGIGAILPTLEREKIPLLFPYAPNDFMYSGKRMIFALPVPATNMVDEGFQYLINEVKPKRIGSVYQDDPAGRLLMEVAKKSMDPRKLSFTRSAGLTRSDTNMERAVNELKEAKVDSIYLAINSAPSEAFIQAAAQKGLYPYYVLVYTTIAIFAELEANVSVISSEVVPLPSSFPAKISEEFKADFPTLDKKLEGRAFFGYLGAKIFVEALRKAGKNLDRQKLVDTLESMTDFNLDGIKLALGPNNHIALSKSYLYKLEKKKIVAVDLKK